MEIACSGVQAVRCRIPRISTLFLRQANDLDSGWWTAGPLCLEKVARARTQQNIAYHH